MYPACIAVDEWVPAFAGTTMSEVAKANGSRA
jgi:hypothetical protein